MVLDGEKFRSSSSILPQMLWICFPSIPCVLDLIRSNCKVTARPARINSRELTVKFNLHSQYPLHDDDLIFLGC